MIYKVNNTFKYNILYEKLVTMHFKKKNDIVINKLSVVIKLPSNIKFINGFIMMLVLLEKNTNNTPIFLKDINTLSKKRFIKIGLVITLSNELIEPFLQMCLVHSIPKINNEGVLFSIPIKNYNLFYNSNVILSNTIFSFDNEIFQYYSYLTDFIYNIEIIFYVNTKNRLVNLLLVSLYNLTIIKEEKNIKNVYNENIEANILLELGDENYSDSEEDIEELENIDNFLSKTIVNLNIEESTLEFILDY